VDHVECVLGVEWALRKMGPRRADGFLGLSLLDRGEVFDEEREIDGGFGISRRSGASREGHRSTKRDAPLVSSQEKQRPEVERTLPDLLETVESLESTETGGIRKRARGDERSENPV